jgi:hypothetical protein
MVRAPATIQLQRWVARCPPLPLFSDCMRSSTFEFEPSCPGGFSLTCDVLRDVVWHRNYGKTRVARAFHASTSIFGSNVLDARHFGSILVTAILSSMSHLSLNSAPHLAFGTVHTSVLS